MKKIDELFKELNIHANQKGCHSGETWFGTGIEITSHSPVDGSLLGVVQAAGVEDYENAITKAEHAFLSFQKIPAPKRGELVRQLGNSLREKRRIRSISFMGNG